MIMTKYSAIVAAFTLPLGVNALAAQTQQENRMYYSSQ